MKISNITYLQPSTAPLLMPMHNLKKKKSRCYINTKFQKYTYKQNK